MSGIETPQGLELVMRRVELQHLLVMLVEHGLPQPTAAKYFTDLADFSRSMSVPAHLRAHTDDLATHYEDMASAMLGGDLLSRDPKG
jgi:hypothetical protein